MYLAQLFRSFRPLHNPIGFGVADFVILAFALLLSIFLLLRPVVAPLISRVASRTLLSMGLLGAVAVLLRLALLPASPVPLPAGADDFSYVLLADTLRHFRLANPTHVLYQFFETVFVLQQPTYGSIYPLGQGIVLALGQLVFGSYWAGVLLSGAAFCALCYWMLRGWLPAKWAVVGGLLAVMQFGPLNQWTNSYWGGFVSACAGCLVFGALPRMHGASATRMASIAGLGLALQTLTRPFESLILLTCALAYIVLFLKSVRSTAIIMSLLLPALLLTAVQNRSVTGSFTTLPYMLSRYQYGVPTTFTFLPNPVPHRALTPEQELDYRAQSAIHGFHTDSVPAYLERLFFRIRYLRFFWAAPLYCALLFFLPSLRERQWLWAGGVILLFLVGTNFYPYFFPHYIAAVASLLVLIAVKGVQDLARASRLSGYLLFALCAAQFTFWYGIHLSSNPALLAATSYETSDYINFGDPEGRIAVRTALLHSPGGQLVFVRYGAGHGFREWIHNAADIDAARVIWARDLGPVENLNLIRSFPDRKLWLLEPDLRPLQLTPYVPASGSFESVH